MKIIKHHKTVNSQNICWQIGNETTLFRVKNIYKPYLNFKIRQSKVNSQNIYWQIAIVQPYLR
jgi:hypothetical protein